MRTTGGHTLTGRLERPPGPPRAYAVFAHCFTCSKNVAAATRIARELAGRGVAVLRFDFTGLGNSEGDFANTDFSSNVRDLEAAAAALADRHEAPALLIGHSLGGAAALLAAGRIDSVRAVATVGAPSEPAHVQHLFGDQVACIEADGAATVSIGGRDLSIGKQFLDDVRSRRVAAELSDLRKPLLLFHSPVDEIVSVENARDLYEAARHPKSFVSLDGADHMLGDPADAAFVAATLSAWAARYVPAAKPEAPGDRGVRASEVNGGLTQFVRTPAHDLLSDAPADVPKGSGAGPTPHDLALAALAACTSMTLRMYADRKGWPLESVAVRTVAEKGGGPSGERLATEIQGSRAI